MNAALIRGDAIALPLADDSVDLIVTSPPYFALRSYTDGGEHYDGQIGSEATPQDFLEALWAVTRECRRVLKPSGSMWVNLGDKYSGSGGHNNADIGGEGRGPSSYNKATCAPAKSLMGLPWRYAIGCIDDLDLILRAEVIWSKLNGLPESVTDRVRRSHEQWFHFTKEPRYFAAVDEVREAHSAESIARTGRARVAPDLSQSGVGGPNTLDPAQACNPLGKLPGSVWTIPSEPLKVPDHIGVDHFAAFPQEWPRRIILGWSPSGICTACGQGRRPVVEKEAHGASEVVGVTRLNGKRNDKAKHARRIGSTEATITGYICDCDDTSAPTRPAVVLDPFGGTGTVAMVARALGRYGICMDLSSDYLKLAQWRVFQSRHWMKTVTRTHGRLNDKGEWKRPAKREMVKGTMVYVDNTTARCWDCGWDAVVRSPKHGEALARLHNCKVDT